MLAHPPRARSDASVSNFAGNPRINIRKHGGVMHAFLSVRNAFPVLSSHFYGVFFLVNRVSGIAISEKSLINCLLKFTNPRKDWMSVTVFGVG